MRPGFNPWWSYQGIKILQATQHSKKTPKGMTSQKMEPHSKERQHNEQSIFTRATFSNAWRQLWLSRWGGWVGGGEYAWPLMGRSQGCCQNPTVHRIAPGREQSSAKNCPVQLSAALRLRNLGLEHGFCSPKCLGFVANGNLVSLLS